jgi:inorganic pyrophosphatase
MVAGVSLIVVQSNRFGQNITLIHSDLRCAERLLVSEWMFYEIEPDPGPETPEIVRMVVEIPRDSSNKYEFDSSLKLFRLARTLYSPIHYPGDYGFIPGTIAEDNEPLDIICLVTSPSFTGCLTYVRPLAVLEMIDGSYLDHKVLAVPGRDPRHNETRELDDVPVHVQREIEYFFSIYKELEGKTMRMRGWHKIEEAYKVINESRERFLSSHAQTA